jgi:RNA polymerase sigma-70 factor (ECF subfamily)
MDAPEAASTTDAREAAEAVFRQESGRIIATLIRISGSFDRAEEAMQEAFAAALVSWPTSGIPLNPAAWITAAAHRKLIDQSRREKTRREKQDALRYETEAFAQLDDPAIDETAMHFSDDRLRLIFTCCHPALNPEGQVALTLRTLGGLTTAEIAKAFLVPEPTLAQRLVRAKRKIQEARIPYEGYTAASGDQLLRLDLSAEAIRLGRMLNELLQTEPENLGLLALMLLHDSRRHARVYAAQLITLEDQDRTLWDQAEISEGLSLVEIALRSGPVGPYQLQAAIAALHAQAKTPLETDWNQIAALYGRLLEVNPSQIIALNHAVAIAMSAGFEEGLRRIDAIRATHELDGYYLLHAARADILRRMNRFQEATDAYRRALALTTNRIEQDFLTRRLAALDNSQHH